MPLKKLEKALLLNSDFYNSLHVLHNIGLWRLKERWAAVQWVRRLGLETMMPYTLEVMDSEIHLKECRR